MAVTLSKPVNNVYPHFGNAENRAVFNSIHDHTYEKNGIVASNYNSLKK